LPDIMTMHFVWLWYLYSMVVLSLVILRPARRSTEDESREPRAQNPASAPVRGRAEDAGDELRR